MTTLFETIEGRSIFSCTPIEVAVDPNEALMEMPSMPLHHDADNDWFARPAPQWVDSIDPEFFVKPPLARAG